MIKASKLSAENIDKISPLYEDFKSRAKEEFDWDNDPVEFTELKQAFSQNFVEGYLVEDTAKTDPLAFMLMVEEEHRAIEINTLFVQQDDEVKNVIDRLMRQVIKDLKTRDGFEVVSYAMLGRQEKLVRPMPWYGFKLVGQAIVKYNIMDPVTLQILKQQELSPLPEGFTLDTWQPQYAGAVSESIYEAFSKATDSLWDPRFKSLMGAKKVVGMLTQNMMGTFLPECTSVLLKDGTPVGVCFMIQASMTQGNIPLIGVNPQIKKDHPDAKHLGSHLLKSALENTLQQILDGKIGMLEVSATHDTDNINAIKMYRRMGFRETSNYPHAYLTKEKIDEIIVGKWC